MGTEITDGRCVIRSGLKDLRSGVTWGEFLSTVGDWRGRPPSREDNVGASLGGGSTFLTKKFNHVLRRGFDTRQAALYTISICMKQHSTISSSQKTALKPTHRRAVRNLLFAAVCHVVLILISGWLLDRLWPVPGGKNFTSTLGLTFLAVWNVRHAYLVGVRNVQEE
jgi:hypothetical protein